MNTYSMRRPPSYDWTRAFLVSIAAHVLLLVLWIGALLFEIFTISAREFVDDVIDESTYVSMPVEMVEALQQAKPAPVESSPKPMEKSFSPTRTSQEIAEEVKSERYFGERSTQAASEGEAVENGLAVPSQEGRESLTETDRELANSDFADGENKSEPGQVGEPMPLTPETLLTESSPQEEAFEPQPNQEPDPIEEQPIAEPTEVVPITNEERIKMARAKAAKLLALEESIPIPKEEEPEPHEEDGPSESVPQPKPQPTPMTGGVSGNRGQDEGYDREASKTRLRGTIRRKGESSLAVEDSVRGRFLAKVNQEIEKAWQLECIRRQDHILPGILSVSFVLSNSGKVTNFQFDSRIDGGNIQEGFTMGAIQKAKLPPLPEEMVKELQGNQLELNLTFMF